MNHVRIRLQFSCLSVWNGIVELSANVNFSVIVSDRMVYAKAPQQVKQIVKMPKQKTLN